MNLLGRITNFEKICFGSHEREGVLGLVWDVPGDAQPLCEVAQEEWGCTALLRSLPALDGPWKKGWIWSPGLSQNPISPVSQRNFHIWNHQRCLWLKMSPPCLLFVHFKYNAAWLPLIKEISQAASIRTLWGMRFWFSVTQENTGCMEI